MKYTHALLPLCLLTLVACGETVEIQDNYVSARDRCQDQAEDRVSDNLSSRDQGPDAKQRNTMLVDSFNKCMYAKNWDMGKPKDAPAQAPVDARAGRGELANRGVGIGVGPAYALEEHEAERGAQSIAAPGIGEKLVAPVVVDRSGARGRERPQVQGEIPRVQGEIPRPNAVAKPTANDAARERARPTADSGDVRRSVAPQADRAQAPTSAARPAAPDDARGLSSDTLEELKRTIGQ